MVGLCTAPEELPPVDGPARLFVEHPPAGEGPGRHERRIPLRLGNPSTVHHFDGTRPRAAQDFEWDPHHPLASCEQCSATIRLDSILRLNQITKHVLFGPTVGPFSQINRPTIGQAHGKALWETRLNHPHPVCSLGPTSWARRPLSSHLSCKCVSFVEGDRRSSNPRPSPEPQSELIGSRTFTGVRISA